MIWWKPRIQPPVLTVSSGWSSTYSDNSKFKFKMMPLHIDQPGAYLSGIEISRDMSHSPKITWQNTWTCFPCQRNLNPHSSRAEIWSFTWNISSCHHLKVASPYCWPLIRSAQGPWRRVPQTLRWPKNNSKLTNENALMTWEGQWLTQIPTKPLEISVRSSFHDFLGLQFRCAPSVSKCLIMFMISHHFPYNTAILQYSYTPFIRQTHIIMECDNPKYIG